MPVLFSILYYLAYVMPNDQSFWLVVIFVIGAYIGNAILWADGALLYARYNELQTLPQKLITRSILFVIAFTAATLLILTSSGSGLGAGIVIGLGISLLGEMIAYLREPPQFQQRFLYQLKRQPSVAEMRGYVMIFAIVLLSLSGLFLFRG